MSGLNTSGGVGHGDVPDDMNTSVLGHGDVQDDRIRQVRWGMVMVRMT